MKSPSPLDAPRLARRRRSAFSLVEVTIALGIIAFALVTIVALLPAGLEVQRHAVNQAFAAQVLNDVSEALQSAYNAPGSTSGIGLPAPLDELAVTPGTQEFLFFSDGSVDTGSATDPAVQGRVVIDQKPPVGALRPVHVSVAWGHTAEWNSAGKTWDKAQGSLHTFLYIAPQ